MSEFLDERPDTNELIGGFSIFVIQKVQQLESLNTFFTEALPLVADLEIVNTKLAEAGRADLAIVDPAHMMPIARPRDIPDHCNNFSPNFHFYTGRRETGELDFLGEPETEPVPATYDEINALKAVPLITSFDESDALVSSGKFSALSRNDNHGIRPAFLRMLVLFPEFTTALATEMSKVENRHRYDQFEDRLYVAYQLMSRLVDKSDLYVAEENGDIDEYNLCR